MLNIDSLSPGSANGPSFISKDAWKDGDEMDGLMNMVDPNNSRYPFCIVWTPIPLISWLFPLIGHMGIATSTGVIRDFAGPYTVSEDHMAFDRPTKYWQLDPRAARFGSSGWDRAVAEASDEYKLRMNRFRFTGKCNNPDAQIRSCQTAGTRFLITNQKFYITYKKCDQTPRYVRARRPELGSSSPIRSYTSRTRSAKE